MIEVKISSVFVRASCDDAKILSWLIDTSNAIDFYA